MATLYISYFANVDKGVAGDPIKSESITTSGTSAASGVVPGNAVVAKIQSEAAHFVTIEIGTPTASAGNSLYLGAGEAQFIRVRSAGRSDLKIAAITA